MDFLILRWLIELQFIKSENGPTTMNHLKSIVVVVVVVYK